MLSIIIPSHQRADLLRGCLATVCRHVPPDAEVIVVDDASPSGGVTAVAREFSRVHLVALRRRGGFCVAANAGIRASRGHVVELLNDDTEVTPGWAGAALAHFQDPRVAAVAPLVLFWPEGRIVDSAGDRYFVGGVAGKRGHGRSRETQGQQARPVFGASASSGFFRRSALERVGAFPETFGSYFEDVDLALRLQRAGFRTMFEPQARVLHRGSASHRPSRRLAQQQSCNEERVFWRNLPMRTLLHALPCHGAVLLAKAWRRWQEGTLLPFLCGRLRLLTEVPALWRHRRQLRLLGPDDASAWQLERHWWGIGN